MEMVKYQGGYAVALYDPRKRRTRNKASAKEKCLGLIDQKRADFAPPSPTTERVSNSTV